MTRWAIATACLAGLLAACSAGDHHDDAVDARADAQTCAPACEAGAVCCTDEHGHFPACVIGTACPTK